jgi:hypothetical protein
MSFISDSKNVELVPVAVLNRLSLRDVSSHTVEGYKVVATELIDDNPGQDLHKAVLETPKGEFIQVHFLFIHLFEEEEVYAADAGILAPKFVTPREKMVIVYE